MATSTCGCSTGINIHKMGETMNGKWVIVIATGMMLMTGCGGDDVPVAPVVETPARQKQMIMDNAYERGENVFLFDAEQTTQYALYCGTTHIIYLKPHNMRSIKLTSNETLNLTVRKKHVDDTGNVTWSITYSFQNLGIGDYVLFDGSWRVTSYNPANAITD